MQSLLVSSSCKEFVQGLRTSTLVPTVWQTFWLCRPLLIKTALALCVVLSLGEALRVAQTVLFFMARCGGSVLTILGVTKRISSRRSPKQNLAPSLTAVTRIQIPSGTPNQINNLKGQRRFFAGTKRNSRTARPVRPAVPRPHFPRFIGFFVGTKRQKLTPQLQAP